MSSNVSNQGRILACAIATWVIAAFFVALRFYLRGRLMKVLGREDWTVLVSLAFSGLVSASFIVETHHGLGKHIVELTAEQVSKVSRASTTIVLWDWTTNADDHHVQASWVSALLFAITIYLTKFSILFLYMRTLTHHWVQRTLRVLLAVVVLTCLTNLALLFTQCIPLEAVWNASVTASYCHAFHSYYIIFGIQIVTDFLIFLLPLPVIWGMRAAPRNQKLLLSSLVSFGFFICIVSIIRLTELKATRRDTDWTYNSVTINLWSLIEADTGIVCSCVMTMKPLLSRLVPGEVVDTLRTRRRGRHLHRANDSNADDLGHTIDLFRPPTIGSKPSRCSTTLPPGARPGGLLTKKQSWFTAQLARLDRSLQTVNEGESRRPSAVVAHDLGAVAASGAANGSPSTRRGSLVGMFLNVPKRAHLPIPRLSHHSSIITTHVEQEAEMAEMEEGPLEPSRFARRSSCAV